MDGARHMGGGDVGKLSAKDAECIRRKVVEKMPVDKSVLP